MRRGYLPTRVSARRRLRAEVGLTVMVRKRKRCIMPAYLLLTEQS
jgi:hypothetical protein